ncbi:envelope stress response membrane protein PspB [Paraglaciecola aquimarina]|uniref:Envelope stress response membrane protein PspB n=1 Tax=Paraglaciecola aquimarina TaxID=1235557 RepID=A0ABU3T009_9ALTE|nr:envelope stress response membrane protein PspB [Paraglaciecola aquimarina]MDU0355606.1 envelope stress response membrane protein PspB [Paraglaciecola aquimarina]
MEDVVGIIVAPIVIFLIFVAPIWLIMHYRSKKQINQGLTAEQYASLQELANRADKMTDRIHTLESILDAEAPQWRNKV